MLLRLCPPASMPTILFTLALPALPDELPLPHAWATTLDTLATHDLPSPPSAHALDAASGHIVLVERVTFDLVAATVACVWLDGRTSTHSLSPECIDALDGVVRDVSLASIEAQREQHRELLTREQRTCPPTPPSSLSKPPSTASQIKHKRKRSTFFSMVSAILSSSSSTSSPALPDPVPAHPQSEQQLPSRLPSPSPSRLSSITDNESNTTDATSSTAPADPCQAEPGTLLLRGPRSRYLRRKARSALVDSFVQYVLPIIREQREHYELWALSSLIRRASSEGQGLLERAVDIAERGGVPVPALPRFDYDDEDDDLPNWPFDDESDSEDDVPIEDDCASGTRSSLEDGSVATPRDDQTMDLTVRLITDEPESMSPEEEDPFFRSSAAASKQRSATMPNLRVPKRRRQPHITPTHVTRAELSNLGAEYRSLQTHASRLRVLRVYLSGQRERAAAEERVYNRSIEDRALRRARSALAFQQPIHYQSRWSVPSRGSPLAQSVGIDDYEGSDDAETPTLYKHGETHMGYSTEEEAAAEVAAARARRRAMGVRRRGGSDARRGSRRPDAPYRRAALIASAARICLTTVPFPSVEDEEDDMDTVYPTDEGLPGYDEDEDDGYCGAEVEEYEVAPRRAPFHVIEFGLDSDCNAEEDSDEEDPFSNQSRLEDFPTPPTTPTSAVSISSLTTINTSSAESTDGTGVPVSLADSSSGLRTAVRKRLPSLSFGLALTGRRSSESSESSDEGDNVPRSCSVAIAPVTVSPPRPPTRLWSGKKSATSPMSA
ncbi:hypothetical protein BKA62DRAFT_220778 [Auriculariales sp. MPI-PUGE-AT-0066]|nr:hypothetical protein BKA62DRAFT_220778 [Auriculariales sp. MPI-PUGE-AT-0066]